MEQFLLELICQIVAGVLVVLISAQIFFNLSRIARLRQRLVHGLTTGTSSDTVCSVIRHAPHGRVD